MHTVAKAWLSPGGCDCQHSYANEVTGCDLLAEAWLDLRQGLQYQQENCQAQITLLDPLQREPSRSTLGQLQYK